MKKSWVCGLAAAAVLGVSASAFGASKEMLKFGVTNFADSLETTDN